MNAINPDDFIAWLTTQHNSRGSLYLERVARHYARFLRTAPPKLDSTLSADEREVFSCTTPAEFDELRKAFIAAPNYKAVNENGHQSFSAGMNAYRRYLEILEQQGENIKGKEQLKIETVATTSAEKMDTTVRRVDFDHNKSGITLNIPDDVIDVLNKNYASGFRFDTTYINLLSSVSGVEVDGRMQSALKHIMFRRCDGIYFLLDIVADAAIRKDIIDFADTYLQEYGCFEIQEFYNLYESKINLNCIRNAGDFENFYEQIGRSGVHCVQAPYIGNRIARYSNGNVWSMFKEVATKIISVVTEEYYGSCNEDDLHAKFCVFSTDLLGKIIKRCAADALIRVEINGSVCYQTFDALGLPENFSDVLAKALERLSDIGLDPTQDALHTILSLTLGVNFRTEYNLPDWDTYRRLIAAFYKAEPRREWKSSIFGEAGH